MTAYQALTKFICWEAVALLTGIFVAIARQSLTRHIKLRGLLSVHGGSQESSPTRVQLLVFTIAYALYYLMQILQNPSGFPPIPHEVLYALGGSQSTYLFAKGLLTSRAGFSAPLS